MSAIRDPMENKLLMVRLCKCGHSDIMHRYHHDPHSCAIQGCDCKDYKPMDWITGFCIIPIRITKQDDYVLRVFV